MKRMRAGLLALVMTVGMAGCTGDKTTSSAGELSSREELSSVPPVLGLELEKLLTAQEVSAVLEQEMAGPEVYEGGIWIRFSSPDYQVLVDINMDKATQEMFEQACSNYPDLRDDEESGENAKWSTSAQELLKLEKGYMIGIRMTEPGAKKITMLKQARAILEILTARLPEG